MLSILPYDRLTPKDSDRPFKAYNRSAVTSIPSPAYPYQQSSYISSFGYNPSRPESMDLRPPPAHMYEQNPHHLMDMSQHGGMRGSHVKPETDNMHYMVPGAMSHIHGYHSLNSGLNGGLNGGSHGQTDTSNSHHPQTNHMIHNMVNQSSNIDHSMHRATNSISPITMHRATNSISPPTATATSTTSPGSTTSQDHLNQRPGSGSDSSSESNTSRKMPPKKRALCVPEDLKDNTYWEKRKKNNDSAKRSREARRVKEEQIAMRVVYLEQENLQLRTEVSLLRTEIEKLRCMLYNS